MNEDMLYEKIDFIANHEGNEKAYKFFVGNKEMVDDPTPYLDIALYRMAAKTGHNEEALNYMEEAIIHKKLWYSDHTFMYDDLKSIAETERFKVCRELSKKRYDEYMKNSHTYFSWKGKSADKLIVVLHGDSENIEISKEEWKFLNDGEYQIEYVMSKYPWTINYFRWPDDAEPQLPTVINKIENESYSEVVLCGFSGGCNDILKSLLVKPDICNKIFMVTPCLIVAEDYGEELAERMADNNIEVIMYCSKMFEEEFQMMVDFEKLLRDKGVSVKTIRSEDEVNEFPENPGELFKNLI